MPIIASLLAAVLPMIFYLLFIWYLDKNEPEPLKFVFIHFLWGAIGAIIFALIGSSVLQIPLTFAFADSEFSGLLSTIIIAPFVEEITKGIFLVRTIKNPNFDNLTDGLVYGAAIGLGFGMTENFMYFTSYGDEFQSWLFLVIIRTGFSAVMHCIATATVGVFLSLAKFSNGFIRLILLVIGLAIAMFIHFLWNFSVSFESTYFLGFLAMLFIIFIFFLTFILSVKYEKRLIVRELNGEIPSSFLEAIYHSKRISDSKISIPNRSSYLNSAVKLAFRKNQLNKCPTSKIPSYTAEIQSLRERLNFSLNGEN